MTEFHLNIKKTVFMAITRRPVAKYLFTRTKAIKHGYKFNVSKNVVKIIGYFLFILII